MMVVLITKIVWDYSLPNILQRALQVFSHLNLINTPTPMKKVILYPIITVSQMRRKAWKFSLV